MVGWDSSKAPVMSHTHTSPPARLATMDRMRSRTGSPRALNTRATPAACSASSGSRVSGGLHSRISSSSIRRPFI